MDDYWRETESLGKYSNISARIWIHKFRSVTTVSLRLAHRNLPTVFLILLHTPSFLLEIRVIIIISSHPWYHIIVNDLNRDEAKKKFVKKIPMAYSKKTEIFNSTNSQYVLRKFHGVG